MQYHANLRFILQGAFLQPLYSSFFPLHIFAYLPCPSWNHQNILRSALFVDITLAFDFHKCCTATGQKKISFVLLKWPLVVRRGPGEKIALPNLQRADVSVLPEFKFKEKEGDMIIGTHVAMAANKQSLQQIVSPMIAVLFYGLHLKCRYLNVKLPKTG